MFQNARHILVVDDDALVRMHLLDILADEGHVVLEAANAAEAIAMLETDQLIEVVVTDIQMPGSMDGVALSHYIRDRWPPVILIVTSGMSLINKEALPNNVPFLPKPIDGDRLLSAVAA